jgi:alkanesulfonate monooxygenase SsuD/methylene tetrahydromethanopterin reductase-like flavin-dependent oxidoreductase (luciferase family)
MKFHWFAEVTYPHLGLDFPQRHDSAWVDISPDLADSQRIGETYHMFLRLMQHADTVGFDGLAVNEHHQTAFAMTPSPNLMASALASTTQNAAILVIGDSLALYNPPTRVAEELGFIDCLSGGRLIAGFVVGTPMDVSYSYGVPPVEIRDRFTEARKLILRGWATKEPFAFNGKYTQLRYVNPWPRPIQSPPPVWVPGTGSPETWDLVLDEGYCYGHLAFTGLHSAKPSVDGFWDRVQERGEEVNPNRMAFTQIICVADTDAEAEAKYHEAVKYFYTHNKVPTRFLQGPGYMTPRAQRLRAELAKRSSKEGSFSLADVGRVAEMDFWELDEKGFIIAGSPERVRQRVRELATELRVGQLITCMHFGNLSEEAARENTHLFGTQVIPHLRDLWEDLPDLWTPAVSQARVAAAAPSFVPAAIS